MRKIKHLKKAAEDAYIKGMGAPEDVNPWVEMAQIILGSFLILIFFCAIYVTLAIFL